MKDWDEVAAYALTLLGAAASTSYGQPAIEVRSRMFVSSGHVPDSFHVLIRYGSADPDRVRAVIGRAWWDRASRALREGHGDRP